MSNERSEQGGTISSKIAVEDAPGTPILKLSRSGVGALGGPGVIAEVYVTNDVQGETITAIRLEVTICGPTDCFGKVINQTGLQVQTGKLAKIEIEGTSQDCVVAVKMTPTVQSGKPTQTQELDDTGTCAYWYRFWLSGSMDRTEKLEDFRKRTAAAGA